MPTPGVPVRPLRLPRAMWRPLPRLIATTTAALRPQQTRATGRAAQGQTPRASKTGYHLHHHPSRRRRRAFWSRASATRMERKRRPASSAATASLRQAAITDASSSSRPAARTSAAEQGGRARRVEQDGTQPVLADRGSGRHRQPFGRDRRVDHRRPIDVAGGREIGRQALAHIAAAEMQHDAADRDRLGDAVPRGRGRHRRRQLSARDRPCALPRPWPRRRRTPAGRAAVPPLPARHWRW